MNRFSLPSLNDAVNALKDSVDQRKKSALEWYLRQLADIEKEIAESIHAVENNRQAIATLDGMGLNLECNWWSKGRRCDVKLGLFKTTKKDNRRLADTLREIRAALACRLEPKGKNLDDSNKHLEYCLEPVDFSGVKITFLRKLPKKTAPGVKCRVVVERHVTRRLVCS